MSSYTARQFDDKLAELVEERMQSLKDDLPNMGAITDYAAYCAKAGLIQGLREVAGLREEAHEILSKR